MAKTPEENKEEVLALSMNLVRYGWDAAAEKILDYIIKTKVTPEFENLIIGMLDEKNKEQFVYSAFNEKYPEAFKYEQTSQLREELGRFKNIESQLPTILGATKTLNILDAADAVIRLREELEAEKEKVEVYRRSIGRTEQDYILEISRKDKALVSVRSELEAAKKEIDALKNRITNLLEDVDVWEGELKRVKGLFEDFYKKNKFGWEQFKSEHNL